MGDPFCVDRSRVDGQARLRFVGELDLAAVERAEREAVGALDHTPAGPLVIDLGDLTYCDSSGINLLIRLQREVNDRGRTMVLRRPTAFVKRVFVIADVYDLFTIE